MDIGGFFPLLEKSFNDIFFEKGGSRTPGKLYLVPIRSGRSGHDSLTFTMASKGGRPVDPIWQIFVRVSADGKVLKASPSFAQ